MALNPNSGNEAAASDDGGRSNGEVLLSAGLIAGAIGGVAALLNGLRNQGHDVQDATADSPGIAQASSAAVGDARSEVSEAAKHLKAAGKQVVETAQTQGPDYLKSVKEDATSKLAELTQLASAESERARKELEKRGVTLDLDSKKVRKALDQVAAKASDAKASGKDWVEVAKGELEKRGINPAEVDVAGLMHPDSELGKQWRDKLAAKAKDSQADLSPKAKDLKETAASTLSEVVDKGKERVDSLPTLSALASEHSFPSLKDLSAEASNLIAGLTDSGKDSAPELKALVEEHLVPRLNELRQRAAHLASDVIDTSSEGASKVSGDDLGKRFAESLAQAEKALDEWRGTATGKVESAQTHVREAGVQAKEGGKNAGASILWLGAAGAVIYAGLLKDEHRQWVKEKTKAIASGTAEVIKDMRGHDGEFTS
ncbi:MAG TPA: hypothetical protein VNP95_06530 [Thermomicrobiales bacterium]|nr:hypothetical protein [Thermomicrobiales bacterium]